MNLERLWWAQLGSNLDLLQRKAPVELFKQGLDCRVSCCKEKLRWSFLSRGLTAGLVFIPPVRRCSGGAFLGRASLWQGPGCNPLIINKRILY
jgi:hypothetical protein